MMGRTFSFAAFGAFVSLGVLASTTGCDSNDPQIDVPTDTTTWLELGPADITVKRIRVFGKMIYADGGAHGLLRADLSASEVAWDFLGLDSAVSRGPFVGIADVGVDPEDPRRLFVAYRSTDRSDPSLLRSLDGGSTWGRIDTDVSYQNRDETWFVRFGSISVRPTVIIAGPLYFSNDSGDSWVLLTHGPAPIGGDPQIVSYHHADDSLIWSGGAAATGQPLLAYSRDQGRTWSSTDVGHVRPVGNTDAIAVCDDINVVFAGVGPSLGLSDDMGTTWTRLSNAQGRLFTSLAVSTDCMRLWAISRSDDAWGLLESLDRGMTWSEVPSDTAINEIHDLLWVDDLGYLFIGTNNGVLRYQPK